MMLNDPIEQSPSWNPMTEQLVVEQGWTQSQVVGNLEVHEIVRKKKR
jgi:hypothetical protein